MSETLLTDLKESIERKQALFIVGTGVSMGATNNADCASWTGLLKHGCERCSDLYASRLPFGWAERVQGEMGSGYLEELLSAAEKISRELGAPSSGEWSRWLRESIGPLKAERCEVLEALRDLNVPLATTNYDSLLSEVTGLPPVTWTEPRKVDQVLRGNAPGILHLHGHWDKPESVVLGIRSYEQVLGNEHAQTIQKALILMKTIVFVGFGAGLQDPNFGALLEWTGRVFAGSEYRRFRPVRDSELVAVQKEHPKEQRLFALSYGSRHEDLSGFLRSLGSCSPPTISEMARPDEGVALVPIAPRCFGRDAEIEQLVNAILAAKPEPMLVLGGPGIGKTALTLAALNHEKVAERFGSRRFFVRCDAAGSCDALVASMVRSLDLTSGSGNSVKLVLDSLEREPALVVLDNAETPWEGDDRLKVEEFLGMLSRCRRGALVVSVRGEELPIGVSWSNEGLGLHRLDEEEARKAFLYIAGEKFAADPRLADLCAALDGVPLAITLMAHAAHEDPNLEGVWQRWQDEGTRMLKRGMAEHRLTSLEKSYEISLHGPRMTDEAGNMLSALCLLPDGLAHEDLIRVFPNGNRAANQLRKAGLVFDEQKQSSVKMGVSAGRLRVLAPLREYVRTAYPADAETADRVVTYFLELVRGNAGTVGWGGGAEAIVRLAPEVGNVETTLGLALSRPNIEDSVEAAVDWGEFVRFAGLGSTLPIEAALRAAKAAGLEQKQADCIQKLGDIALARSELDTARNRFQEALPLFQKVGHILGEADCIQSLGHIALRSSELDIARKRFQEALPLFQKVGHIQGEANCITGLAEIALRSSELDNAQLQFQTALALYKKVGDILGEANCIQSLGNVARRSSESDIARKRFQEALPLYQKVGDILGEANCIQSLGNIALRSSELDNAQLQFQEALPMFQKIGDMLGEANCVQGFGDIARGRSELDTARDRYQEALYLYQRISEAYSIGWTHWRLATVASGKKDRRHHVNKAREAWDKIGRTDLIERLKAKFGIDVGS
jgi:tetratricopeptide (TPR) repeat protein